MVNVSYSEFKEVLIKGYSSPELLSNDRKEVDILLFSNNSEIAFPFMFNFDFSFQSNKNIPVEFRYLFPYEKRKNENKPIKYSKIKNIENWRSIWDYLTFFYIYLTFGKKENPWDTLLLDKNKVSLDIGEFTPFYFYSHLSGIEKSNKKLKNFISYFCYPQEYVQLIFINKSTGSHFINQIKGSYKKTFDNNLLKWEEHISRKGSLSFFKAIVTQSISRNKEISDENVVFLISILATDVFFRRLDISNVFKYINDVFTLLDNAFTQKSLLNVEFFKSGFLFLLSKLFSAKETNNLIKYFPDYKKLNCIAASLYIQNFHSQKLNIDCSSHIKNKEFEYLVFKNKSAVKNINNQLQLDTSKLQQINYLPPYLYYTIIEDFLKMLINLEAFSVNQFNLSSSQLLLEFDEVRKQSAFNLKKDNSVEEWLKEKVEYIKDKL